MFYIHGIIPNHKYFCLDDSFKVCFNSCSQLQSDLSRYRFKSQQLQGDHTCMSYLIWYPIFEFKTGQIECQSVNVMVVDSIVMFKFGICELQHSPRKSWKQYITVKRKKKRNKITSTVMSYFSSSFFHFSFDIH